MEMNNNEPLANANPPAFTSVMKSCCTPSSSTTEMEKPGGGKGEDERQGEADQKKEKVCSSQRRAIIMFKKQHRLLVSTKKAMQDHWNGSYRNQSYRIRLCQTGLLLLFWSRAQFLWKAVKNSNKLTSQSWNNGLLHSHSGEWGHWQHTVHFLSF